MSSLSSYQLRWLVLYSILPATLSADPQAQWATFHSITLSLSHDLSYLHKASKRQTGSQPTWVAQSRHTPHTGSAWTPNLHRPAVTSGVVWVTGSATEPQPGVPLSQRPLVHLGTYVGISPGQHQLMFTWRAGCLLLTSHPVCMSRRQCS